MAVAINLTYEREQHGDTRHTVEKQIMVSIALDEYRSLITENARLICENTYLVDEITHLKARTEDKQ